MDKELEERLSRIEAVLGTLISWSSDLGNHNQVLLLEMLHPDVESTEQHKG